jgi:hypothetical protein
MRKTILTLLTLVMLVNFGFASGVRHHSGARKPAIRKTYTIHKPARRHGR